MDDIVKQILEKPIQLADQVIKAVRKAIFCDDECDKLKSMTEKLAELLHQAARESSMLHERPTRRIIQETEQVFYKALSLVNSRVNALLMCVFPTILVPAFPSARFPLTPPGLHRQRLLAPSRLRQWQRLPRPHQTLHHQWHNIVKLLVHHLALLTAEENSKYEYSNVTRFRMKECATRALCFLAKGNSHICRSIADSRAFLCFAVLLETVPEVVRYNAAMAVMEITAVAEKDPDFREYALNPNSPAFKTLVDQVFKIIEKSNSNPLIPCIETVGNFARATAETRMIDPLVKLLRMRDRDTEVHMEALIALTKYACTENEHYMDNSKAILSAGGAECLIHLVYSGEHMLKIPAVVLLSYIVLHVLQSEKFAQVNVILGLEWAS